MYTRPYVNLVAKDLGMQLCHIIIHYIIIFAVGQLSMKNAKVEHLKNIPLYGSYMYIHT